MTEAFLQYVWQHQLLEGSLATTDGQSVKVLNAGELNTDAGPDFFNARLQIAGVEWIGNVEIHIHASDWRQHGHSSDAAYNNVILHVVYDANEQIATQDGHTLPTLSLHDHISPSTWSNYEHLILTEPRHEVACADKMAQLPRIKIKAYLERLTVERLERKTSEVHRLLEEAHGGWEQCCYWLMAHYFGGKANAFPFELLAKATDMRLLARWKDNPQRIEALLMGQAGLLDTYFNDDYPRQLQADYQALRSGSDLRPISAHLWKFFRLRPSSFPTLRISQFAQLVSQSSNLFSKLLATTEADQLAKFFDVKASPYWETHYQFDKPSQRRTKSVGHNMAQSLIINAWVPLLFEYGNAHDDDDARERALDLLRQMPAEDNSIIKTWGTIGINAADASESQALIQLYNEHCKSRQCLQCHIGLQVIKS